MPKTTTTDTPVKSTTSDKKVVTDKKAATSDKKVVADKKSTSDKKSTKQSQPKTQEAKKSTKRTADGDKKVTYPDAPKNKRNAYTFFFSEKRDGVKNENGDLKFGEITAKVAEMWNNLPDAEKKNYEKEAAKDAKRYEKEREKWDKDIRALGAEPDEVLRSRRDAKKRRRNRVKKPKGARNPYVFFSISKREELKAENLEFNEMTKRLGEEWAKVSEKDRKKYEKMAETDRERYEKEMETFRQEHPDQDSSKKSKRRKKAGEPKGSRNAYIFFSNEERDKVRADNPDMAPKDVMTELGKRWNDLADKAKYVEMAENDKKRHEKEMKKWTASQTA